MDRYYKVDSARVSVREYWEWADGLSRLWLILLKAAGVRLPQTLFVPASPAILRIPEEAAPADLVQSIRPGRDVLEARGCSFEFFYRVPTRGLHGGLAAALLAGNGSYLGLVTVAEGRGGAGRLTGFGLMSRLTDGSFLGTGDGATLLRPPDCVSVVHMRGRPLHEIVDGHEARVAQRTGDIALLRSAEVEALISEAARLNTEVNVARGVYVPATESEILRCEGAQQPDGATPAR